MARGDRVRTTHTRPAPVVPRQESRPTQRLSAAVQSEGRLARLAADTDGRMVTATLAGAATTTVRHGLGRTPKGWRIERATGTPPVVCETTRDADGLSLQKTTAGACVVTLWIW
uniref:Uncharacterized protein n=1 Tax=viral metagenome TaxID=1070528 RepID=A0A6M3J3L2_9ZZZZ